MKRAVAILVVCTVALGSVAAVWLSRLYDEHERALSTPLPLAQDTLFTVAAGSNFKQLTREFAARKWLREPQFLYWYARHKKLATNIKAGTYSLNPGMSVLDAINLFVDGRETQYSFSIIEGWNFRQLRAALGSSEHLEQTLKGVDDQQVMALLQQADRHPEGMFLADTYLFPPGTTDLQTLQRANAALQQQLDKLWQSRQEKLPLVDAYQTLILASIIEKETADPAERPLIAGVFIERLRRDMLLQTDPTVIYGLGPAFDGNLRRRDLRADTPYNTYTRKGLPPTPIAIVGESALRAAMNPQVDGSLFFVSRGDGSHQFSRTYAQHLRAVRKYQLGKRKARKSKANQS